MATTFPNAIQTFPTMINIESSDGATIDAFHTALKNGDMETATNLLHSITNYDKKIVTTNLMNTIIDTCVALENYYTERYSPAYIFQSNQPAGQETGDYWFKKL